ncbi:hypothetical protein K435DRAFT_772250 [Dendrothele bispora CBS 962.96]|uniref:Uncharacterized protein n=1 Tax=Dendrothele bispora (strain CBS 962.96) TaxID=1314807 RepID=A0A4S8MX01_DENBC|nr:hypothetical protein K435DRAFT_772250 [Dendrothele bispora CBS 962.96]
MDDIRALVAVTFLHRLIFLTTPTTFLVHCIFKTRSREKVAGSASRIVGGSPQVRYFSGW